MNDKCKFCGAPLEGYETFCPECGKDLPTAPPEARATARPTRPNPALRASDASTKPRRKPSRKRLAPPARTAAPSAQKRMLMLVLLMLTAAILLGFTCKLLFNRNDQRAIYPFTAVVDQYFDSVRTGNANLFIDTRPEAYTQYLTEGTGSAYANESEYRAKTAATLQTRLAGYQEQYGKLKSISYDITALSRYNHRCEALSSVLTGWYNFPENAVTDAYIINGVYTIEGANGSAEFPIEELLLIQIGDAWYFSPDAGSYWRAE